MAKEFLNVLPRSTNHNSRSHVKEAGTPRTLCGRPAKGWEINWGAEPCN